MSGNPAFTARDDPMIGMLYINGRSLKKDLHILFRYIRHSKYQLNTKHCLLRVSVLPEELSSNLIPER